MTSEIKYNLEKRSGSLFILPGTYLVIQSYSSTSNLYFWILGPDKFSAKVKFLEFVKTTILDKKIMFLNCCNPFSIARNSFSTI